MNRIMFADRKKIIFLYASKTITKSFDMLLIIEGGTICIELDSILPQKVAKDDVRWAIIAFSYSSIIDMIIDNCAICLLSYL